jgi:hypothetical protein
MGNRRRPTAHQKQIRFLGVFFGAIMVVAVVVAIILFNRPVGGYH